MQPLKISQVVGYATVIWSGAYLSSFVLDDPLEMLVEILGELAQITGVLAIVYQRQLYRVAVDIVYANKESCDKAQPDFENWLKKYGFI